MWGPGARSGPSSGDSCLTRTLPLEIGWLERGEEEEEEEIGSNLGSVLVLTSCVLTARMADRSINPQKKK